MMFSFAKDHALAGCVKSVGDFTHLAPKAWIFRAGDIGGSERLYF